MPFHKESGEHKECWERHDYSLSFLPPSLGKIGPDTRDRHMMLTLCDSNFPACVNLISDTVINMVKSNVGKKRVISFYSYNAS